MKLLKRFKTLWILSGWDIKKNKVPGAFTIDGIVRPMEPEFHIPKRPHQGVIIKRTSPSEDFLNNAKE